MFFPLKEISNGVQNNTNNGVSAIPQGRSVYPTKAGYDLLKPRFLTITIQTWSGWLPYARLSVRTGARFWK